MSHVNTCLYVKGVSVSQLDLSAFNTELFHKDCSLHIVEASRSTLEMRPHNKYSTI